MWRSTPPEDEKAPAQRTSAMHATIALVQDQDHDTENAPSRICGAESVIS